MKNKITAFAMGMVLALNMAVGAYAEKTDDVITVEVEAIKEEDDVQTGTRQTALESVNDVDKDIEDEIEDEMIPDWETIKIKDADDLTELALNCRLDTWSRNKHVELTDDIDLTESDFVQIPSFGGTFEGNGHVISNYIFEEEESYAGFFAYLQEDAIVKDLTVKGRVEPSGKQVCVGGIAGENNGVLLNCCFDGVVAGKDYVGGIAGFNELNGIICDSVYKGILTGTHFSGGIAGENMGNLIRCTNEGRINTSEFNVSMSLEDINIDSYVAMLESEAGTSRSDEVSMNNGVVDSGGIAGLSIGIIRHCTNKGDVGYEHIGYNVGGIAGRQSGYIFDCINEGNISGRKDVGGIVGQAEPYVTVDLSQDIAYQLSENIEKLHDIISVTLKDADNESDTISNRLSIIQQFTGNALTDTRYLADGTIDYANGISNAANDAFSRVDYVLEESGKKDGALDQISYSASNAKKAAQNLKEAVDDLDIYDYLSDNEKAEYDGYKATISDAGKEYDEYLDAAKRPYYNYYIYNHSTDADYNAADNSYRASDLAFIKESDDEYTYNKNQIDNPVDGRSAQSTYTMTSSLGIGDMPNDPDAFFTELGESGKWIHHDDTPDGADIAFPNTDSVDQNAKDEEMIEKAGEYAAEKSRQYADKAYSENHPGHTYSADMSDAAAGLAGLIDAHLDEMSEETRQDAGAAMNNIENAADNLESSFSQTKDIIKNLGDRDSIAFPQLSSEYRAHTASLSNNLQGMNDNFGYLNTEMNDASDKLIKDLQNVSDQFNVIMMLYTDAIDGALDMDYSNTIQDDSLNVAKTCTDATVDYCKNNGTVSGDINIAGIAGTMAIEYDFDLESDVTGIKDSALNTTFITKCVLRDNSNYGKITAEKSYVGGVCGLQEMGTILGCGCYNDVISNSGSYVGGITGSSLSHIVECFAKCMLSSSEYVGGIAGDGDHISDCVTLVKINDAVRWYGAIAGHVSDDGVVRNNRFVSNDLAGIDRVSYNKKAWPITYGDLMRTYESIDEAFLPEEFKTMKITFVLDDEDSENNGEIMGETVLGYGERISINPPKLESEKEGYYLDYEDAFSDRMYTDEKVPVRYVRYRTTLSGPVTDGQKQSSVLVDGQFREDDILEAVREVNEEELPGTDGIIETWNIKIPDDGNAIHQLRYVPGDTTVLEKLGKTGLYLYENGNWTELESTGSVGKYQTYEITGNNVTIQSRITNINRLSKTLVIAGVAVAIILVIILILTARVWQRKKKGIAKAAKKIGKAAIEAVSNIGSQNDIFYHGCEDENGNPIDEKDEKTENDR